MSSILDAIKNQDLVALERALDTELTARATEYVDQMRPDVMDKVFGTEPDISEAVEDLINDILEIEALTEEQIDLAEISKATLGDYIKKAARNSTFHAQREKEFSDKASQIDAVTHGSELDATHRAAMDHARTSLRHKEYASFDKKLKRHHGIAKAVARLTKEDVEELSEISSKLLGRYVANASLQAAVHGQLSGIAKAQGDTATDKKNFDHTRKRLNGIRAAGRALAKKKD